MTGRARWESRLGKSLDARVGLSGEVAHGSMISPIVGGLRHVHEVVPLRRVERIVRAGNEAVPRVDGSCRENYCCSAESQQLQ